MYWIKRAGKLIKRDGEYVWIILRSLVSIWINIISINLIRNISRLIIDWDWRVEKY
jgi:hypothetical protein